jgi:hypothetical protein
MAATKKKEKKKEQTQEQELTPSEVWQAKEKMLLTWLLGQLLTNELFVGAEPVIAESAMISISNKEKLAINRAQRKEVEKFTRDLRNTAIDYKKYSEIMPQYISRSERYDNVLKYAIEEVAACIGKSINDGLEKYPKEEE